MLEALMERQSGLLGVSGLSSDMRQLHAAEASNADARLAIEMFCYSVRKQIAAMIAVLDGVDRLIFTGGIGENDSAVRAAICAALSWIGISLDERRNEATHSAIHNLSSRCAVNVFSSQEEQQIARHTWKLCST